MLADGRALLAELDELDRRNAQRHVIDLGRRVSGRDPARHMVIIGSVVHRWVTDPAFNRVMIFAPPRHGKSWYSSWFTPAYLMGQPAGPWGPHSVMHITHSQRFTHGLGRRIRNTLGSERWPWPDVRVLGDRSAALEWETSNGNVYNGFGMDGSPTGRPATHLILDDPIRGRKEAFSETLRDSRWEVLQYDVWSRLEGPQKQLWCLTRWHEDDPAGRVLPEGFEGRSGWYKDRETGDQWYVLSLPAIAEHENDPLGRRIGEWLWPEVHGPGTAIDAARRRGGYLWSSLYQQRPSPEEGLFFRADTFRYFNPTEIDTKALTIYGASDYAATAEAGDNDPDWTVHMIFGVDRAWNIYVLDMWRGRTTTDVWAQEFLNLCKAWRPTIWAEETQQIEKSVGPFLLRMMLEQGVHVARRQFTSSTSKEARAQAALGMAEMGRIHLPRGVPWLSTFEQELKQFPAGRHDDQVDTLSLFCRMLAMLIRKPAPQKDTAPPPDSLEALYALHEVEEQEI